MTTSFLKLGFILLVAVNFTACNKEEFYQKQFLSTTGEVGGVDSGAESGGGSAGVDAGVDGGSSTGGSVDAGSSTSGSSTGGSSTGGSSTGGSSTGGYATGGATGGSYQSMTETFNQSASSTKKLDILWVIDDSGSMADEQDALGTNFSAFIDNFIAKNVDFKMAITSTDCSSTLKCGKTVSGSDTKLTSAKAGQNSNLFKSDFQSLVNVGTAGSGNEKGLQAAEQFMIKDQDPAKVNKFLRSDAYLAVVIVSDEEDQSPKLVDDYTNALKGLKSSNGLVKVYSVVDVNDTNFGNGVTVGSARYKAASNNTAGLIMDIRDDFYNSLSGMGESIINLLDSFALGAQPIPGSLKVYVNDVLSNSYTYDSTSRSIKFNQNALPPVGAVIKVTYLK
jgi:hypothetical protein